MTIILLIFSFFSPWIHCQIAECSESTGLISTLFFFASGIMISPAHTRDSLLAWQMIFFALTASIVGLTPIIPTTATMTTSASLSVASFIRPSIPVNISTLSLFFLQMISNSSADFLLKIATFLHLVATTCLYNFFMLFSHASPTTFLSPTH